MCLVRGNSKLLRIVIMTIFASFFHHVKEDCRGETTSFTNDEQVLFFRKRLLCCSWCTVNFNSYYTSQPNDCALALLRRPGRHLSIKYQTDNQPCVRAALAYENHYHIIIILGPNTKVETFFISHFLYDSEVKEKLHSRTFLHKRELI